MTAKKNKAGAKARAFYLLLAAVVGVSVFSGELNRAAPLPLGGEGYAALALLAFAILSWCLQLAPIAVTALAVLVLLPFTGLMDFAGVIQAGFGDSTFAFFLGVLLLSAAFQKTPLGRRIALLIFRVFGRAPRRVLLGLMLAGTLLAMWVTEVAAAAILYPLALSIVEQSRGRPDAEPLARTLMLGVAWGPAFGGVATPIATGANLVAVAYLEQYAGISISFGEWMGIGLPISFTLLAAGWLLLARELPRTAAPLELNSDIPPMGRKEAFLVTEYGGIAFTNLGLQGKLSGIESWGYHGKVTDLDAFMERFESVTNAIRGIPYCEGYCYTQLTDVMQEINGLLTPQRQPKVDAARFRAVNISPDGIVAPMLLPQKKEEK